MDYSKLLQKLIDIGEMQVMNGAENFRTRNQLCSMCQSYGFIKYDVLVLPYSIHITAETPDNNIITQSRYIEDTYTDYSKLRYFTNLVRYVCDNTPDITELEAKIEEGRNIKNYSIGTKCIAFIMAAAGFTVYFGGDVEDTVVACMAAVLMTFFGEIVASFNSNMFLCNAVDTLVASVFVYQMNEIGIGDHPDTVIIGIVMLLISTLGIITGLRESMQRNFISGFVNISNSMLGTLGIVFGVVIAMMICHDYTLNGVVLHNNKVLELVAMTIGCTFFALLFNVQGKLIAWCGVGAFSVWTIYLIAVFHFQMSDFAGTLIAALFIAIYGTIAGRITKTPSTVFMTIGAFPLFPGSHLYYLMYHLVHFNMHGIAYEANLLLATCIAITLGLMFVDTRKRTYRKDSAVKEELEELDS